MTELVLLLTPLLVLPVVLLFRFVGCAEIAGLEDPAPVPAPAPVPQPVIPNYRDIVMQDKADIIGYWRLTDPYNEAFDETGKHNGSYRESKRDEVIPGEFITFPSLVPTKPTVSCRFYNGGYVIVPAHSNLFTLEFTIEAWVRPDFGSGEEHTVFQAGGFYRAPFQPSPAYHGFRIFATAGRAWQVELAPAGAVFTMPPLVPLGKDPTHLAVSVKRATPSTMRLVLYINGKSARDIGGLQFYQEPAGAPLLMAVQGKEADPASLESQSDPAVALPLRGALQEVVLYRTVRTPEQIDAHFKLGGGSS